MDIISNVVSDKTGVKNSPVFILRKGGNVRMLHTGVVNLPPVKMGRVLRNGLFTRFVRGKWEKK